MQRKHYNWSKVTNTRLASEHVTECGICASCIRCGTCEIGRRARDGRALFPEPFGLQFGAEKRLPSIRDLQILPNIFGDEVFFQNVKTHARLGGFRTKVPIVVASMGSTKVAWENRLELNEGAAKAGIICGIGENIMSTYGEETFKQTIQQYLDYQKPKTGAIIVQGNANEKKIGIFEKAVEYGAHGIELKISQGAKPGLGGEIVTCDSNEVERYKELGYTIVPFEKKDDNNELLRNSSSIVKDEKKKYTILNNGQGSVQTCYHRHGLPGAVYKKELKDELINYSRLEVPIWIKVSYGYDILDFLNFLAELKKDESVLIQAVTVDGHGAGTGMAPWEVMNEFGMPSASILKNLDKMPFDIIVSGGFTSSSDVAKALMLGADGVAMGRAFLIAAKTAKAQGVVNFVSATREELKMICACLRKQKLSQIKGLRDHLFALSDEASRVFGVRRD